MIPSREAILIIGLRTFLHMADGLGILERCRRYACHSHEIPNLTRLFKCMTRFLKLIFLFRGRLKCLTKLYLTFLIVYTKLVISDPWTKAYYLLISYLRFYDGISGSITFIPIPDYNFCFRKRIILSLISWNIW